MSSDYTHLDPWKVLGVRPGSSLKDIKNRYDQLINKNYQAAQDDPEVEERMKRYVWAYLRLKKGREDEEEELERKRKEQQRPEPDVRKLKNKDELDPWEVLDLDRDASKSEIKRAYQKEVNRYDKDDDLSDKERRYIDVLGWAYRVLNDVHDRSRVVLGYDGRKYRLGPQSLKRANLRWVDLSDLNLSRFNLSGADLYGANLNRCNLRKTNFNGCNLESSSFKRADAMGASFVGARMAFSNLTLADFRNTDLRNADLTYALVKGAKFKNVTINNRTKIKNLDKGVFRDLVDFFTNK